MWEGGGGVPDAAVRALHPIIRTVRQPASDVTRDTTANADVSKRWPHCGACTPQRARHLQATPSLLTLALVAGPQCFECLLHAITPHRLEAGWGK